MPRTPLKLAHVIAMSFLLFVPLSTHAKILINEIAWMGTETSANDEWIELYNDGSSVSVDGWVLTDNVSLNIELAGTIGAGEFAVLERTDDSSAPGIAFLIYTGALSNDGRILILTRSDNSIEDQVAGGENWENIGGDNVSKNTAQRSGGGWVTAAPTPGQLNKSEGNPNEIDGLPGSNNTAASSGGSGGSSNKKTKSSSTQSDDELHLSIIAPSVGHVNQEIPFRVVPSGALESLSSFRYLWNFGDLGTKRGEEVTHAFSFPGRYVVVAAGGHAIHQAMQRYTIQILPITFSMTRTPNGDVQIHNNASNEVDLSGYLIKGDTEIVVPDNTILLPNTTLTIDGSKLERGTKKMIGLYDNKQNLIAMDIPDSARFAQQTNRASPAISSRSTLRTQSNPVTVHESATDLDAFLNDIVSEVPTTSDEQFFPADQAQQATVIGAADSFIPREKLPFLGLIGVILIALLAVYTNRPT